MQQLQESALLATKYMVILCATTAFQNKSDRELSSYLSELIVSFSRRSAAEAAALTDAADYEIPDILLNADVIKLRENSNLLMRLLIIIMISRKNLD